MGDLDDTPARLVTAAEQLFAEAGEEGTSLRAVARAALASAAAVHYHFGGRDELLRAVLHRHLGPLNGRRLKLLAAGVAEHGEPVPVEALIEAAVRPDLELLAKLRKHRVEVARFLGRAYSSSGEAVVAYLDGEFDAFAKVLVPMLERSRPDLTVEELRLRLRFTVATVAAQFAHATEIGTVPPLGTEDIDQQVRRLVAYCAGGFSAPATAVPAPPPDALTTVQAERARRKRKKR